MYDMFYDCQSLETLDLSGWNVSNVNDMSYMFKNCKNLKYLDLSGWDTSNVMDVSGMFYHCPSPYTINCGKIVKK